MLQTNVLLPLQILLGCATLFSILYVVFASVRVLSRRQSLAPKPGYNGPVTILKPLCGLEPGLYENLRSFCEQDYPQYEVLFGIRDPKDPVIPIAQKVMAEFPKLPARLVVNGRTTGPNYKVANLANMCAVAKHDVFVLADSDMRVTPGYLQAVVAPFGDPGVGATTCLYRGTPVRGVWSILGGMGINEWFLPSVLVATTFGRLRYCFGATIAVRRAMLDKIGGFASLVQDLADDYLLGQRVSGQGLAVRLAPYIVDNVLHEPSLQALFVHELRWARTIRALKPLGYAFSFLTYPIPLACLSVLVLPSALGVAALGSALVSRVLLHFAVRTAFGISAGMTPWLVPVREILGFSVWCASFLGRSVQWRTKDFVLDPTGRITPKPFGENKRPLVPECQPD